MEKQLEAKYELELKARIEERKRSENEKLEMQVEACKNLREFSKLYTNEFIWAIAMTGNRHAVAELYSRTKKVWLCRTPVSQYGNKESDDWEQIGALKFLEKWMYYTPEKGYKFITYMGTIIRNTWLDELRSEKAGNNKLEVFVEDFDIYVQSFVAEFSKYVDADYIESYYQRFSDFLEARVPANVYMAYLEKVGSQKQLTNKELGVILNANESTVKNWVRSIKKYALEFIAIEKERELQYEVLC